MSVDVLLVALGSTTGLRLAEAELAGSLERAGLSVAVARAEPPREVRTFAATDLGWALAARRAARAGIAAHRPQAVVYSTTTAALLWPRRGAIRFDALAAANRPGRHGFWQRPQERRRLAAATLLLPQDDGALAELGGAAARVTVPTVVVPIPVDPSGDAVPWAARDIAAITYAANPAKKGLDRVLAAWALARSGGEELVVCGIDALPAGAATAGLPAGSVRVAGLLAPDAYRALLRRSRLYVTAPRREDHGIAQLEALADGCALVTTTAPGPYAALGPARTLDPRWVLPDGAPAAALAAAIRAALDDPPADLAARGPASVATHSRAAVDALVATRVAPLLRATLSTD
ncbi:hypothetical protein DSM112329_05217 [Paraconexibacter sp. AEG42_29]|uniref:Glycosyltransferase n=1 Tax=Paraconexibacter sp. AEG42_29 TaxID=2997339 RepID=A0AAU7B3W9_9ACTN